MCHDLAFYFAIFAIETQKMITHENPKKEPQYLEKQCGGAVQPLRLAGRHDLPCGPYLVRGDQRAVAALVAK